MTCLIARIYFTLWWCSLLARLQRAEFNRITKAELAPKAGIPADLIFMEYLLSSSN